MSRKRTRAQVQEEKKAIAMYAEDLYAVFGYNEDIIYIPLKGCTFYLNGGSHVSGVLSTIFGLKRTHYTVYTQFNKVAIYRTEKPDAERKAIPFASVIFTGDEKKYITQLSSSMVSASYFDGQRFNCRADQLVLTTEPGEKTFMLKDCFFHEEYSRSTYVCLKKGKKAPEQDAYEIERTESNLPRPTHESLYT
jgi:hypothetical protein